MTKHEQQNGYGISNKGRLACRFWEMNDDEQYTYIPEVKERLANIIEKIHLNIIGTIDLSEAHLQTEMDKIESIKSKHKENRNVQRPNRKS